MANRKSIRKPPCNPPPGCRTEEQLRAETGAGKFQLKRWVQKKLVPSIRISCQSGRFTFYPEIAIEVVRCIQTSPDKRTDKLRWTLWLKGFNHIDETSLIDQRLESCSKQLVKATPVQRSKFIAEAIRNGVRPDKRPQGKRQQALRGKRRRGRPQQILRGRPLQPILSRIRNQAERQTFLECAIDIARGAILKESVYDRSTKTSATFAKAIGGLPDLQFDIENMSLDRLRRLYNDATVTERKQGREDCARLANAIASSLGSVRTVENYTTLIKSWRWLNVRAFFVPFLIYLRRLGYVEIFLGDFETAVMMTSGSVFRRAMRALRIPDASLDDFEIPPRLSAIHFHEIELHAFPDAYDDTFEVPPGFHETELHAYNA